MFKIIALALGTQAIKIKRSETTFGLQSLVELGIKDSATCGYDSDDCIDKE